MQATSIYTVYLRLKWITLLVVMLLLALTGHSSSTAQTAAPGLRVQGVTLVDNNGTRFVVAGLNLEMYRDYANDCAWVTDGTYAIRDVMADKIKSLGVNVVRLNYSYSFLTQADNLSHFLDMAQEFADRGIYVVPSDHTFTSNPLTDAASSYPIMKQIIDGMRERGLENYLIMNPFNEPEPGIALEAWVQAQQAVLTYLRSTAGFDGVILLDGSGWATLLDVKAFKSLMTFDANLRGGTANLVFSMHLYPNIQALPKQLWTAAKEVPLVVGELGQENPGVSALDPQYVRDVIAGALNTGIPNGHNGLFAWIFNWCDSNAMLQAWTDPSVPYTADSPLTSHGTLWQTDYFSKLTGQTVLAPTRIAQQPTTTPTSTPSATTTPATAPSTDDGAFYRAINLGGAALSIDSHAWEASATAPNLVIQTGTAQNCNPAIILSPAVDAATEELIKCYVEHWSHSITLSAVPNAEYDVYVYTWQDWNDPNPAVINFSLNGEVVQAGYQISSQPGHWERLGPWRVNVTTGSLALTTNGGTIKLSGLELWHSAQ